MEDDEQFIQELMSRDITIAKDGRVYLDVGVLTTFWNVNQRVLSALEELWTRAEQEEDETNLPGVGQVGWYNGVSEMLHILSLIIDAAVRQRADDVDVPSEELVNDIEEFLKDE